MRVDGWTESRFWSFIRSTLRRTFQRFPNKYKALANAKVDRGKYECAGCNKIHKNKDVSVDHIIPCGSLKDWDDLSPFVSNLLCSVEGLQVLCKKCHYNKTMKERGLSEKDIKVVEFKKLKASGQRLLLIDLGLKPASNLEKRIEQYKRVL